MKYVLFSQSRTCYELVNSFWVQLGDQGIFTIATKWHEQIQKGVMLLEVILLSRKTKRSSQLYLLYTRLIYWQTFCSYSSTPNVSCFLLLRPKAKFNLPESSAFRSVTDFQRERDTDSTPLDFVVKWIKNWQGHKSYAINLQDQKQLYCYNKLWLRQYEHK